MKEKKQAKIDLFCPKPQMSAPFQGCLIWWQQVEPNEGEEFNYYVSF
jgi:hypothetical protein